MCGRFKLASKYANLLLSSGWKLMEIRLTFFPMKKMKYLQMSLCTLVEKKGLEKCPIYLLTTPFIISLMLWNLRATLN